jgi:hypothetical protein
MAGKSRRENALKHGAFSKQTLLWGETQEEYDAFRVAVYAEWQPEGPSEEQLAESLLNLLWRARRYRRREQMQDQKKLDAIRQRNEVSHHVDRLRAFAPEFEKAATKDDVEKVLANLPADYDETIRSRWPLKEDEDPNKWGERNAKALAAWIVERHEDPDEFLVTSDPMDISLLVEGDTDAQRQDRASHETPCAAEGCKANLAAT